MKYPVVLIHAEDWNQYPSQHNPDSGEPYTVAIGFISGFLIEETEQHYAVAHQYFEHNMDVRYVTVIPKRCVDSIIYLKTNNDLNLSSSALTIGGSEPVG